MTTSALRVRLASILPVTALLAVLGCGGSSSTEDDCSRLCSSVATCATALETTVATLLQEPTATADNCAELCRTSLVSCNNKTSYFVCLDEISCDTIVHVQDEVQSCQALYCLGPT